MRRLSIVGDLVKLSSILVIAVCVGPIAATAQDDAGILPLDQGLTLARTMVAGTPHVLAVVRDEGETVTAVDLSVALATYPSQPLDLFAGSSLTELVKVVGDAVSSGKAFDLAKSVLIRPMDTRGQHVATAVNYPAHAVEAGAPPRQPFLFAKFAPGGPSVAQVADTPGGLFDYEVELGVVVDRPIASATDLDDAVIGFTLVTDMTDRYSLVGDLYPGVVKSDAGVASLAIAKSGPDRMQMADYVVVPFDRAAFQDRVEIRLAVNGETRQQERVSSMTEDADALIRRSFTAEERRNFSYRGAPIRLLPRGAWEPGMVLLTGTPSGTAFRAPAPPDDPAAMSADDIRAAVEAWADTQRAAGTYLKVGDRIDASGTYLGSIQVEIVPIAGGVN